MAADTALEHTHELPAPLGTEQLLSVEHPLGTMDVEVYCLDAAGNRLGFLLSNAVDVDVIDVVAPPGCAAVLVRRELWTA